jgi:hypothetical protein
MKEARVQVVAIDGGNIDPLSVPFAGQRSLGGAR